MSSYKDLPPSQKVPTEEGKAYEDMAKEYSRFYTFLGKVEGLKDTPETDKAMRKYAWNSIKRDYPDAPEAEQIQIAEVFHEDNKKKMKRRYEAQREAAIGAVKQGILEGPEMRFGTEEQQKAIDVGKSYRLTKRQAIAELVRDADDDDIIRLTNLDLTSDELNYARSRVEEDVRGKLPWQEGMGDKLLYWLNRIGRPLQALPEQFLDQMEQGREGARPRPETQPQLPIPVPQDVSVTGIPREASKRDPSFVAGQPMVELYEKGISWAQDLHDLWKLMDADEMSEQEVIQLTKRIAESAKTGAIAGIAAAEYAGKAGEGTHSLAKQLKRVDTNLRQDSWAHAQDELPNATEEEQLKRAEEIHAAYMDWMVENPNLTQFIAETMPEMFIPVTRAAGAGVKAGLKIAAKPTMGVVRQIDKLLAMPGGKILRRAVKEGDTAAAKKLAELEKAGPIQKLIKGFQYMPEAKEMEKAGEVGEEFASLMRLAPTEAQGTIAPIRQRVTELMPKLEGLSSRERKLSDLIVRGEISPNLATFRQLEPRVTETVEAAREMAELHEGLRLLTGVRRRWKGDVLEPGGWRAFYAPRRVLEGESEADAVVRAKHTVFEQLEPGSTKTVTSKRAAVADLERQWDLEWRSFFPKAEAGMEVKLLGSWAKDSSLIYQVGKAPVGAQEKAFLTKAVKRLEEVSGIEWGRLDTRMANVHLKIGAERAGEAIKNDVILMPRPYIERLRNLVPIVGGEIGDTSEAVRLVGDFNKYTIRPAHKIWRMTKTLANPSFSVRNAVGGFGLSTLAFGVRAFDPKLQIPAIQAAVMAGLSSPSMMKLADNTTFMLKGGKQTTLGEVIRVAHKHGVVDQLDSRLALDLESGGGLDRLVGLYDSALSKVGLKQAAAITENYQHLVSFMGVLEGFEPKQVAKAMDFMSKFSGNYSRLGSFEKEFMRDAFGFYSWMRYIFPHITNQIMENPQKLAAWARFNEARKRHAPYQPFSVDALAPYMQGQAFSLSMASKEAQPKVGTHQYAVSALESPLTMGLSIVPALQGIYKGAGAQQPVAAEFLGMGLTALIEGFTGRDIQTGMPLPAELQLVRFGKQFVDRPTKAFMNIIKLYGQANRPAEMMDLYSRYQGGRDLMGIDYHASKLFGFEYKSLGGMFAPEGEFGSFMYTTNPLITEARRKKRIRKEMLQRAGYTEREAAAYEE